MCFTHPAMLTLTHKVQFFVLLMDKMPNSHIFLSVCIHDPSVPSVLWLAVAACQYRLRASPPVRVSADCVKGGEGRGVCFAKHQRRGVSHQLLSLGWSLHGPCVVHQQHLVGQCLSQVDTELLGIYQLILFLFCCGCSLVLPVQSGAMWAFSLVCEFFLIYLLLLFVTHIHSVLLLI